MNQWQPIETAPDWYSDVLLWDGVSVMLGYRLPASQKWLARYDSVDDLMAVTPIAWMPLPEPPK